MINTFVCTRFTTIFKRDKYNYLVEFFSFILLKYELRSKPILKRDDVLIYYYYTVRLNNKINKTSIQRLKFVTSISWCFFFTYKNLINSACRLGCILLHDFSGLSRRFRPLRFSWEWIISVKNFNFHRPPIKKLLRCTRLYCIFFPEREGLQIWPESYNNLAYGLLWTVVVQRTLDNT